MNFDFGFNQRQQRQPPIESITETMTAENWGELTKGDKVWLVQFYSDHSQNCRTFSDAWEQSAKRMKGFVEFGRVNVYESARLHKRFRMEGTPSLMLFADGQPITVVAERPSDRWGGGGPLSSDEVTRMAMQDFPDAIERLPSEFGPPTVTLIQS